MQVRSETEGLIPSCGECYQPLFKQKYIVIGGMLEPIKICKSCLEKAIKLLENENAKS